ncbi:hypothetical protein C8A05DRAFT_12119 [Staphylotrichum tortipilum]|uniref:Uncharacterized protein n=1 Tax=Staphylotrichum tortipilum TaxID=2831512 RepID=A0AAN6MS72_9PEZI|nr:hypothetical protein C8A05DRAFT_12119 [Staphylotrichum longicolle]
MQPRAVLVAVLTLGLSAPSVAHPEAVAAPAVTPPPLMRRADVQECAKAVAAITSGLPTPTDSAIVSWLDANDGLSGVQSAIADGKKVDSIDKLCSALQSVPAPPASLSSAVSSYFSGVQSWQSSVGPSVSSAAAKCTGNAIADMARAGLQLVVATDVAQCKSALDVYNKAVSSSGTANRGPGAALLGVVGVIAAVALF